MPQISTRTPTRTRGSFFPKTSALLRGAAFAALMGMACHAAVAATAVQGGYPARPVTIYVPVAAGGAADALARAWASYASNALGGTFVVDNKAGANGSIAAGFVAKQRADGYALLFGSSSNMSVNPFTYKALSYNPEKDFDPITMVAGTFQVLVANPKTGIRSVQELVTAAKAKPGTLNYGSAGIGNSTHLNMALLVEHFGLDMTHVPYKGAAPAMADLIGGQLDMTTDALIGAVPQVRGGKAVPLVIFGLSRVDDLPGVPTAKEVGVNDYPGGGWYGLVAPKGVPREVVEKLTEVTRQFWQDEQGRAQLAKIYMASPNSFGPEGVTQTMKHEVQVWGPLVRRLKISND